MKRKIYKLCLFVIALVTMVGCRQVPFAEYSTMADWTWIYSNTAAGNYSENQYDPLYMEQYADLSLMDCSQGYISHQWIVEEGVGIYFISEDLDSDDGPQIVPNANYVTSEPTIHLYFEEWREEPYEVRLLNTYNKQVSYTYQAGSKDYTTYSTYQDGVYVADTTIRIRVFSASMTPMARVFKQRVPIADKATLTDCVYTSDTYAYADEVLTDSGEPLPFNEDGSSLSDTSLFTNVEIEYGNSLYFVDVSTDSPDTRTWTNAKLGSFTSTAEECEMVFNLTTTSVGKVTYNYIRLASSRSASGNMPSASSRTVTVPISVTVVDNTQPYNVDFAYESNAIRMNLDGAAFDDTIVDYGNDFVIRYYNTFHDVNGTGHQTDNASGEITNDCTITYDSDSPSTILIKPSTTIYNTDMLVLEWLNPLPLKFRSKDAIGGSDVAAGASSDEEYYNEDALYYDDSVTEKGNVVTTLLNIDFFYDFDNYIDDEDNYTVRSYGDMLNNKDLDLRTEWVYINDYSGGGDDNAGLTRTLTYNYTTGVFDTANPAPQPDVIDDPYVSSLGEYNYTLKGERNKVLRLKHHDEYAPVQTSTTGYSNYCIPYLLAGFRLPGINTKGGTYDLSYKMYIPDDGEYKTMNSSTSVAMNLYAVSLGDPTTIVDPANDQWDFNYKYDNASYAWMWTVAGTSNTWWNACTTAYTSGGWKTYTSSSNYTGSFDSTSLSGDAEDCDWIFFNMSLYNLRGTLLFDNFIIRNVELRPNTDDTIGCYGTNITTSTYTSYYRKN